MPASVSVCLYAGVSVSVCLLARLSVTDIVLLSLSIELCLRGGNARVRIALCPSCIMPYNGRTQTHAIEFEGG